MSVEAKPWRVGMIGVSPAALFLIERMSLEPDIHLVGAFEQNSDRRKLIANSRISVWENLDSAIRSTDTDVLVFADRYTEETVAQALSCGKQVVLDRPWQLSSEALRRLYEHSSNLRLLAVPVCHHRWSAAFLVPMSAKDQLGAIHSVRYSSCEQCIIDDQHGTGVLREFEYAFIDQLLQLVKSKPQRIFAKRSGDGGADFGLALTIEFSDSCLAVIDLQTRSRLSHRTGWMLEGNKASFRSGRLYETTSDGEIVDEAVPALATDSHRFLNELLLGWQGRPTEMPSLEDAANVVRLIELVEQSARSNQAINVS